MLPKSARDDVFKLYTFVHYVHGICRSAEPNLLALERLTGRWKSCKEELALGHVPHALDDSLAEHAVASIAYLSHRYRFDKDWIDAFLASMSLDAQKHEFHSFKEAMDYTYGSSEVIAFMLVRIMNLPEEAFVVARTQARAIQCMSFIRELHEDLLNGRCYFPPNEYRKYGLKNLSEQEARDKPRMFEDFIHAQLLRYATWQAEANDLKRYIPKRTFVLLQAIISMHTDAALRVKNDPLLIYEKDSLQVRGRDILQKALRQTLRPNA